MYTLVLSKSTLKESFGTHKLYENLDAAISLDRVETKNNVLYLIRTLDFSISYYTFHLAIFTRFRVKNGLDRQKINRVIF